MADPSKTPAAFAHCSQSVPGEPLALPGTLLPIQRHISGSRMQPVSGICTPVTNNPRARVLSPIVTHIPGMGTVWKIRP